MKRTPPASASPPPIRRPRRRGDPEKTTHFADKTMVVTLGGTVEFRHARSGRSPSALEVTCTVCSVSATASGPELQAFYREHYDLHSEEVSTPAAPVPATVVDVDAVIAKVRQLAGDELAVLDLVAQGLVEGRATYGQLDVATDKRAFGREALHEARDQVTYDIANLLRRVRGGAT